MMKKGTRVLMALAAGFSGSIYLIPNTILLDKLQSVVSLYRRAEQVPVSLEMKSLTEQVMSDMKLKEEDRSQIRFFTPWGFECFYAGSIWKNKYLGSFTQAIIGIPEYFYWKTILSMDKDNIVFRKKKLDWTSETGLKLEKSLKISDKAKKFALAQQIYYVSQSEPLIKAMGTSVLSTICCAFVVEANTMKVIQGKQFRFIRYSIVSLSVLFNFILWFTLKDIYRCSLEKWADETVAKLGKEYIEGGLEFYDSLISRNMAIESLTTDQGEKSPFSRFGNEKIMLRQKHLPLNSRRDFFKKLLTD